MTHIGSSTKRIARHQKSDKVTSAPHTAQDCSKAQRYSCRTRQHAALSRNEEDDISSRETLLKAVQPPGIGARTSVADLVYRVLDKAFAGGVRLTYNDAAFHRFNGRHWAILSEEELGGVILHLLPNEVGRGSQRTRATIREVIDLLKMHQATGPDRSFLDEPRPIINVANGELWVGEDGSFELREHDPASRLRYCLEVVYDPAATCPLYDRALTEIFSKSTAPNSLVDYWNEFVGYVLQPARPDARIFVGWGQGNDGKSALTGLLADMLGKGRVAALPVGKLASNPFMLSHLAEKHLFLDDDVAVGATLPDGLLKTISEAKVVTGEPKHRDPFEFQVRAVPLLLCNSPPRLNDTSRGFYRRVAVTPFNRRFTEAEADRTLFSRIRAMELSGVLNRALAGLQRVIQRGWKFAPPEAVIRATEAWWAEATRAPLDLITGSAQPTFWSADTTHQQARTVSAQADGKPTVGGEPTSTVSPNALEITVSTARESCAVKVQAEAATTVEVRVIGAARPPRMKTAPLLSARAPRRR